MNASPTVTIRCISYKIFLNINCLCQTMLTIRRSDVPLYLRRGSFLENLDAQDGEPFDVPLGCFKDDASVTSESELMLLLRTVRYWGLLIMPVNVFVYILETGESRNYEALPSLFPEFASYLESVLKVKEALSSDRMITAIKTRLGALGVHVLRQKGYTWNESACESAARMSDLECLMYLHSEGCPWGEGVLLGAVGSNSLPCLQYALDFAYFNARDKSAAMNAAARKGHLDCMRLLLTANSAFDILTMISAIIGNQLESAKFLHSQGCVVPTKACLLVTELTSCLELLRFFHEEAGADLTGTLLTAAEHGRLDCLQYAHQHGEAWHPDICMMAARGGHLDCLRYAHENGCPWNEETVKAAVSARSWLCLKYALQHGCGWGGHVFIFLSLCFAAHMKMSDSDIIQFSFGWWVVTVYACVLPCLAVLMVYKKHLSKYLTAYTADRIERSILCLMGMGCAVDGILEARWSMVAFRSVVLIVSAGLLWIFNTYDIVFGVLPMNSPHWYQLHPPTV